MPSNALRPAFEMCCGELGAEQPPRRVGSFADVSTAFVLGGVPGTLPALLEAPSLVLGIATTSG